jgi:hypothetical protein
LERSRPISGALLLCLRCSRAIEVDGRIFPPGTRSGFAKGASVP